MKHLFRFLRQKKVIVMLNDAYVGGYTVALMTPYIANRRQASNEQQNDCAAQR